MKHFIIEAESRNPLPEIINWYKKINPRHINDQDFYHIKKWTLLDIKISKETIFPDILSDPYFLLSADATKVVESYEPDMQMIQVRLFSQKDQVNLPYYLPILPVIDCLSEQSEFIHGDVDIKKGILMESKTEGRTLFQLAGIDTQRVVIRLDLLESLLRREAVSIRAQELDVIWE